MHNSLTLEAKIPLLTVSVFFLRHSKDSTYLFRLLNNQIAIILVSESMYISLMIGLLFIIMFEVFFVLFSFLMYIGFRIP